MAFGAKGGPIGSPIGGVTEPPQNFTQAVTANVSAAMSAPSFAVGKGVTANGTAARSDTKAVAHYHPAANATAGESATVNVAFTVTASITAAMSSPTKAAGFAVTANATAALSDTTFAIGFAVTANGTAARVEQAKSIAFAVTANATAGDLDTLNVAFFIQASITAAANVTKNVSHIQTPAQATADLTQRGVYPNIYSRGLGVPLHDPTLLYLGPHSPWNAPIRPKEWKPDPKVIDQFMEQARELERQKKELEKQAQRPAVMQFRADREMMARARQDFVIAMRQQKALQRRLAQLEAKKRAQEEEDELLLLLED